MDRTALYGQLDDLLELDSGTVTGATVLREVEGWNSMAVISLIAMIDSDYGLSVRPKSIAGCATAEELAMLVEQHQAAAAR